MQPDTALIFALDEKIDSERSDARREKFEAAKRDYLTACKLSVPLCGFEGRPPRMRSQVLQRAGSWHTKALKIERALARSLGIKAPDGDGRQI